MFHVDSLCGFMCVLYEGHAYICVFSLSLSLCVCVYVSCKCGVGCIICGVCGIFVCAMRCGEGCVCVPCEVCVWGGLCAM